MNTTAHGKTETFLLCIALGVGYAMLGWLSHLGVVLCVANLPLSALSSSFTRNLPFLIVYGCLYGAAWSVFAIPILRHTSLKPAGWTLGLLLALIAIGRAILGVFRPEAVRGPFAYILGPTAIFIITCIVLRRVLPAAPPLSHCRECGHEMHENKLGICANCGDTSLFRRHSRHVGRLALVGLSLSAGIAALFLLTRNHSCGYWGSTAVVGFGQGALLIHSDPLTYEGWFWTTFSFVPMSGYVWWPVFTEKTVLIPLWALFVLVFALSVVAWRRSRRRPPGCCQECDYDLTGNTTGVCPECGTEVAAP